MVSTASCNKKIKLVDFGFCAVIVMRLTAIQDHASMVLYVHSTLHFSSSFQLRTRVGSYCVPRKMGIKRYL